VYDLDREFDGLRHEMKVNPIYCYLNIYLKKKTYFKSDFIICFGLFYVRLIESNFLNCFEMLILK
jgi:hypothetical protein